MEPVLLEQIPIVEDALRAMGVTVWAMEKYEADDALASGVAVACEDRRVHQVRILTPDKDLGQCVSGRRVVQVDRRNNIVLDESAIREKFGIGPESIADYLALVGDTADGFPGLPGWGAKSASTVLARYIALDAIPDDHEQWKIDGLTTLRGAEKLATTLRTQRKDAELFRTIATLVQDVPVGSVDSWKWNGAKPEFTEMLEKFGATHLLDRLERIKTLSQ
jgi:5'-3' exonuclease